MRPSKNPKKNPESVRNFNSARPHRWNNSHKTDRSTLISVTTNSFKSMTRSTFACKRTTNPERYLETTDSCNSESKGPGSVGTAFFAISIAHGNLFSVSVLAMACAISGILEKSRFEISSGFKRKNVWDTSINFSVTMVTMVKAIRGAFAGTMPCHPIAPRGLNTSNPYKFPSKARQNAGPQNATG